MTRDGVQVPVRRLLVWRKSGASRAVGIVCPNYSFEHVSYALRPQSYDFYKIQNFPGRYFRPRSGFWEKTPVVLGLGFDLLHSLHHIPLSQHPFVMSFEMELPHYLGEVQKWQIEFGLNRLESGRCKALLAFSDIARDQAVAALCKAGRGSIASKISTFRGGVTASAEGEWRKQEKGPLRLLFVGGDGLRKGLVPTFQALKRLRQAGIATRFTAISALPAKTYAARHVNYDVARLRWEFENEDWVHYEPFASPDRVRQLMRESDIFIMPTLDDTLGWVLIEAGMEKAAVLTTDIFAASELVEDGVTGKLVSIPIAENRRWKGITMDSAEQLACWETTNSVIQGVIEEFVAWADCNREGVLQLGIAAEKKLSSLYNVASASLGIKEIYDGV